MSHAQTGPGQKLDNEIPIGDGIDAVFRHFGKIKESCHIIRIDGIGGAGQSRRTQRHDIDPFKTVFKALAVPGEHFVISHQMMGKKNRLGSLSMRISRHDDIQMSLGQMDEDVPQRVQLGHDPLNGIPQIHPQIQRNLVVAASPGMQFLGGIPDQLLQPGFNVHVNIFQAVGKREPSFLDFYADPVQAFRHLLRFFFLDHSGFSQHPAMGDTPFNIPSVKTPIRFNGRREHFHALIGLFAKTAFP